MTEVYKVDGMTCGGCAASVEKAIRESVSGASARVDLAAATVAVDGADAATVRAAVEAAGFTFAGAA